MATISTKSTSQHMQSVHNQLLRKFSKKSSQMAKYAQEIQTYLNEIKNGSGPEWDLIKNNMAKIANFRSAKNLFRHQGGIEFEVELTALLEALANYYFNGADAKVKSMAEYTTTKKGNSRKVGLSSQYHTGGITGTIKLIHDDFVNAPDEFLQMMMQGKGGKDPINDYIKAKEKQNWRSFIDLSARQIKSDVTGSKMGLQYMLEWKETDKLTRLLALLGSFNFSLKNYSSMGTMWETVHLGNTNTFKAYAGVLGALGYSNNEIYNSFYRAINCFQSISINASHSSHGASLHMGHIQTVYEMIGMGLYYLDKNGLESMDNVDFLIINDYSKDGIIVLSTDALAIQILNGFNKNINIGTRNFFGGGAITINANKI